MDRPLTSILKFILDAVIALTLSGCSYAVLLSPRAGDSGAPPTEEQEVTRASATVSDISLEFGLRPTTELKTFQEVGAEVGHRVLAVYGRDADRGDNWSKVLLIAYVDEHRHFVVLVRDWSSIRETQFMKSLRQRLVSGLRAALSQSQIEVRRLHDTPIFYVP
jgi:hypothetical protein